MADNINLGNIIPSAAVRNAIYAVFAVVGVGLGAIQVGYSAATLGQPVWLTVAMAVYSFLGAAGLGVAVANTPSNGDKIVAASVATPNQLAAASAPAPDPIVVEDHSK